LTAQVNRMAPSLDHVALLVPSAVAVAERCKALGWELGPVEDFPAEGTREVYVGPQTGDARLLLMEAIAPGPYRDALAKRGPGLHHVAIHVDSIAAYVAGLARSGWLLHPSSLDALAHRKTVYLARPGLCALIEAQERPAPSAAADERAAFITDVHVDGAPEHARLLEALGVPGVRLADAAGPGVTVAGRRIPVAELARR
jgi:hypothetical protein